MQFELALGPRQQGNAEHSLRVGPRLVPLYFVGNRRARRYVLRLKSDGAIRVTVPRGGTLGEAQRFAERNAHWVEEQLLQRARNPPARMAWAVGAEILFRGEPARLQGEQNGSTCVVRFGTEAVRVKDTTGDLRREIERHLWNKAAEELPRRVKELAALHKIAVVRVAVRNQRSRWGSCSRRGTISLNWRLIQAPEGVRDYIILHEMAHFKEMNHSEHFWREVKRLCPDYAAAEGWLKKHGHLLR